MAVRRVGAFLGVVALSMLAWAAQATTAEAHVGSKARLYVTHFAVEPGPSPDIWNVHVHLIDDDSARPVPGLDVKVTGQADGGAPFGPVALTDPSGSGHFSGTISAPAGPVTVSVEAEPGPGGEVAIPLQRSWKLVLKRDATAPASVGPMPGHDEAAHHGEQRGGTAWRIWLIAGVGLVAASAVAIAARHRLRHESLHLRDGGQRQHS